jgi:hypothetical protein
MSEEQLNAEHKALRINLDSTKYGTFAEIGAGQEVARHFFVAGGAAGTVAKSISAYDMQFSDVIYGKARRYVSRERLVQMMEHEYGLLEERLTESRGTETTFFAFGNTVAALNYKKTNECHGWMGVRFQLRPGSAPHDIILHVRMLDRDNSLQQEAIGFFGVNLIYGAFHFRDAPDAFIKSLADNVGHGRIEVDMIEFNGPDFENVDNRILSLKLVEAGLTEAVMFDQNGRVEQPAETLYKKSCLIERGSLRPLTKVNVDMLEKAQAQFIKREDVDSNHVKVFMELTLSTLGSSEGEIDHADYLARIDCINACGYDVLVSNLFEYYKLSAFLRRNVSNPIGLVMGLNNLADILKEEYYEKLEGGILEALGILFKDNIKIYAYPIENENFERYRKQIGVGDNVEADAAADGLIDIDNLLVAENLRNLYKYVRENGFLEPILDCDRSNMGLFSRDIFEKVQGRQSGWEKLLPPCVAKLIEEKNLWRATE